MPAFTSSARFTVAMLGVAGLLVVSACSSGDASTGGGSSTSAGTGMLPGYQDETLEFTPLIISVLSPEAVPVQGSDGKYYVAYELNILNAGPRDATMTKLETLAEDENGEVIATTDQLQIAANTMLMATTTAGTSDIPAGGTVIVVVRAAYPTAEAIPEAKDLDRRWICLASTSSSGSVPWLR